MPRILLHFDGRGGVRYAYTEGIEIICVDDRAPADRVYRPSSPMSDDAFDAIADAAIAEQPY